jgi:hypothetical protein
MLLHASAFLEQMTDYRTCFLAGGMGKGKTSLACHLGRYMIAKGYAGALVTNFPVNPFREQAFCSKCKVRRSFVFVPFERDRWEVHWARGRKYDDFRTPVISPVMGYCESCGLGVERSVIESVMILDEAWQFMDNRHSMLNEQQTFYGAWARKNDSFWIFPSAIGIDVRVRRLEVARVSDVQMLPFTCWVYKWSNEYHDSGWFAWLNPEQTFGSFHTKWKPRNDGGIYAMVRASAGDIDLIQDFKGKGGKSGGSSMELDYLGRQLGSLSARVAALESALNGNGVLRRD